MYHVEINNLLLMLYVTLFSVLVRALLAVQRGSTERGVLAPAAAARAAAEALQRRHGEDHAARAHADAYAVLL